MRQMPPGRLTLAAFLLQQEEKPDVIVAGSFVSAAATFECGGCGNHFKVDCGDAGFSMPKEWSAFDFFVDAVRWGLTESTSVQGGYILCHKCTGEMDDDPDVPDDRSPTAAEVHKHFCNNEDEA